MANADRLVGTRVDKYIVKKHLKRGGMADVYLAHDEGLDRAVALKVALSDFAADPSFVERFRREARAVARLRHPNMVQVYATGVTAAGDNYIAMEYIAGGTLTEMLATLEAKGEVLTVPHALAIMRQVADALHVAHRAGIIHRDLKPSNILMRRDTTPVITDLGIAVIPDNPRLTRTDALMGTPNYMSPEQAVGRDVDGRSDIYALGVILYELLAGQLPFQADTPWGVLHKHLYENPTSISQLRREVEPETDLVVATCLHKEPDARYQTAAELMTALDTALAAEGSGGYISSSGYWVWRKAPTTQPRVSRETVLLTSNDIRSSLPGADTTSRSAAATPAPTPPGTAVPPGAAQPAKRPQRWWLPMLLTPLLLVLLFFAWRGVSSLLVADAPTPPGETPAAVTPASPTPDAVVAVVDEPASTPTLTPAAGETAVAPTPTTPTPTPTDPPTNTPQPTDTSTPTLTPTRTETPAPTSTRGPTATPTPGNPSGGTSSGSGVPLGFEEFGVWIRGDEENGTFVRSTAQAHSGSYAGQLSYDFATSGNDYVVFLQNNSISGTPNALQLWVYGDGSAHFLNAWIADSDGQTWQVPFGQIFHNGWAQMTGYIDTDQNWPWTHISGPDNGVVDYPISFRGFVLDDYNSSFIGSGTIYLDDLTATTLSDPDATRIPVEPTNPPGGGTTPIPTSTTVAPPSGNVGRILYSSGNTLLTTDPDWTNPVELGTIASDTCSTPASTITGQSFNLYFGFYCGIGDTGTGVCASPNGVYEVLTNSVDEGHSVVVRAAGSDNLIFVYQGQLDTGEGIRWSPNSESFLFVVGDTVHRALTNGNYNQIIPTAFTPIFSQDGSMILYRKPIGPGVNDVFVSNNDGSNQRNVTNVSAIDKRCAAWRN